MYLKNTGVRRLTNAEEDDIRWLISKGWSQRRIVRAWNYAFPSKHISKTTVARMVVRGCKAAWPRGKRMLGL